jgi:hypothetical protein
VRASGGCYGSQNSLDRNWNNGTANWRKDANLQWLTDVTTR